jgi:transposase
MTADELPDDLNALKAMVLSREAECARLLQIIKELQRHRFGRRAETLPEDQLLLGLEEVEQVEADGLEEREQASSDLHRARVTKRRTNRGSLPAHLLRIEIVVDIDDHACPCCRNDLHRIGEDVSEKLDIVPAQFRVLVVRRPKYACRACEEVVVQAAAPARLIEGGIRPRQPSPRFWFPNTPTTCHFIAKRNSTSVRGSISTVRRLPIGSAVPPGICGRSISGSLII